MRTFAHDFPPKHVNKNMELIFRQLRKLMGCNTVEIANESMSVFQIPVLPGQRTITITNSKNDPTTIAKQNVIQRRCASTCKKAENHVMHYWSTH